nr:Px [Rice yellow mottle virus]
MPTSKERSWLRLTRDGLFCCWSLSHSNQGNDEGGLQPPHRLGWVDSGRDSFRAPTRDGVIVGNPLSYHSKLDRAVSSRELQPVRGGG